jgi:hypothetical protein
MPLGRQIKPPNGRFLVIIGWLVLDDYSIGDRKKSPTGRFSMKIGWLILRDCYHQGIKSDF